MKNILLLILCVVTLTSCARNIVISPNIAKIERSSESQTRIKKNVGYYISDESTKLKVITPGGGGDSVTYSPYSDIETAYYKMLTNVFERVHKLKTPSDVNAIKDENLSYIITPKLVTNSSSSSILTWPPTRFTVDLTCEIRDVTGKLIENTRVVGEGQAEFRDLLADHAIAGKRATEDALLKMQSALFDVRYENPR